MTLQLVPFFQDLRQRDPSTGLLVVPTSVAVLGSGSTSSYAPLFSDFAGATSLSNPLPVGVAPPNDPANHLGGVDTNGNAGFWIAPGTWDLIINGTLRAPYDIGVSSIDASSHLANTDDAHSFQTWAAGQFISLDALGAQGGVARLNDDGNVAASQLVIP